MKAVYAYTLKGKIIVKILRCLFSIVHLLKGRKWKYPKLNFSEDPLHYSLLDGLYFGYKYYYAPHTTDPTSLLRKHTIPEIQEDANEQIITLTAAGDLMPYEWIDPRFCENLWDDIGEDFFASDLVIANLETPIDESQPIGLVPELMLNNMEFNGDASMFKVFNGNGKYKGFDVMSTANNHSYDKGEAGIINTLSFLYKEKIKYCGTASTWEQRNQFPIIDCKGVKIAFIAYTYSLNHLKLPLGKEYLCNHIPLHVEHGDLSLVKKQVALAHERGADFVVASVHFGNAYQLFPSEHIVKNTYRLFDECGVDLILGGHAHNIQPIEYYPFTCPFTNKPKRGFVTYCMGDFVAYDIFTWGHLPVWLKIEIAKSSKGTRVKHVEINPIYTSGVYKNATQRDLRFWNAETLWTRLRNGDVPELIDFNKEEAQYLETIYHQVYNNSN